MRGRAHPSFTGGEARGPADDERDAHAALVAEVLVHREGRVAEHRPARAVGTVRARLPHARELLTPVQVVASAARDAVESEGTPLVAGAVVAGEDDDRALKFAGALQVGQDPADAAVDVLDHGGEDGHAAGEVLPPLRRQRLPGGVGPAGKSVRDVIAVDRHLGAGRQSHVRRQQAETLHPGEPFLAENVPAATVGRQMALDRLLGRLDREMRRGMREVNEPGRALRPGLPHELQRIVGEDVGGVEPAGLGGQLGLNAFRQPGVERRVPLVLGMRIHLPETEIMGEAALNRAGPAQMPLADHVGGVAGCAQGFRKGGVVLQQMTGVGRPQSGGGLGRDKVPHPRLMGVTAGEQRSPGRTATGGGVTFLKPGAAGRDAVEVRRRNLTAVAPQVGIAQVVGQNQQHVGPDRLGGAGCGQNQQDEADKGHQGDGSVPIIATLANPFAELNAPIRAPKDAFFALLTCPLGGRSYVPP